MVYRITPKRNDTIYYCDGILRYVILIYLLAPCDPVLTGQVLMCVGLHVQ